ncbi:MAG: DUF1573 domain-containing protein [Bacteroidales bacterium]|jgi:hypothetical protein|nr:DUF1573 domain-containing protein [Bacteroidales bacterium]
MKKLFVLMSMIVAFSTITFAQDNAKDVNPHAPYMDFDKLVHDYGKIMENGDGNCVFTLTNTGKEPLILTDAKSTCGCTVPEWTKAPILPGKSTEIKVKYSTNRVGPINKSVTIVSNASNSPVVLRIKGEVVKNAADQQLLNNNVNPGAVPVNN